MDALERDLQGRIDRGDVGRSAPYIVRVVVHVVYNEDPPQAQNISDAQIQSQLNVLNEDFRRMVGTHGYNNNPVGADTQIEFRLARVDPFNHPTSGITRTSTASDGFVQEGDPVMFARPAWATGSYLNIWVCNLLPNGLLGYAVFPGDATPQQDGVVIDFTEFGDKPGSSLHIGRIATHEVGHYLNVFHTFQNGCDFDYVNCAVLGDHLCDTPPVADAHTGCPTADNSCHSDFPDLPDQLENYMDYTDGRCKNLFTEGQRGRMWATLEGPRIAVGWWLDMDEVWLFGSHGFGPGSEYNVSTIASTQSSAPYTPMTVLSGNSVTIRAGAEIRLNPGFWAKAGSSFRGWIDGDLATTLGGTSLTSMASASAGSQSGLGEAHEESGAKRPQEFLLEVADAPVRQSCTIRLGVPQASMVRMDVYDVAGRLVERLMDGPVQAGLHQVSVPTARWGSGVYFVRARAGTADLKGRIVVVK